MISQIKQKGFEKYRSVIDEKLKERKCLEITVDSLQKQYNAQHKHLCLHGMRHIQEMNLMKGCGDVKNFKLSVVEERLTLLIKRYQNLKKKSMR
jgi:hypothetical protein